MAIADLGFAQALLTGERRLLELVATGEPLPVVLDALCTIAEATGSTASIAHEVNQPLAGIVTNASTSLRMLAQDPPDLEGARETARRTIRDANRAAEVIARLRALFAKGDAPPGLLELNEATHEVVALWAARNEGPGATFAFFIPMASH